MSASAPLSTDMKFYFSGPSGGSDDNRKYNTGGALATPLVEMITNAKYNWFPDVSRVTMTWTNDGQYWYQYACFLMKNTSATFTMSAAILAVSSTLIPSDAIVGIGTSPKNSVPTSIVNINTAPAGITFKEKVGSVLPSITLSDMLPGEYYAVWVRLRQPHAKPLFKWANLKFRVDWTNVPVVPPPPPPESWVYFQDSTGPVLSPGHIFTIFHGGAWDTASNPSMNDITSAITAICNGTYFTKLSQYRDMAKPTNSGTYFAENYDLQSTFTDTDMRNKLSDMIDANDVPTPASDRSILYVCFPDQNASRNDGATSGHSAFSHGGSNVHYVWSETGDNTTGVMQRISKQIVNGISNPEPFGTVGTPGIENKSNHGGLADYCSGTGTSSGVAVAQYFSEENAACVVP